MEEPEVKQHRSEVITKSTLLTGLDIAFETSFAQIEDQVFII